MGGLVELFEKAYREKERGILAQDASIRVDLGKEKETVERE